MNFAVKQMFASLMVTCFLGSSAFAIAAEETPETKQYTDLAELKADAAKVQTEFKEGVHYKIIQGNGLSAQKEVREYFSFFCGHCHAFYPVISLIAQGLPEDTAFVGNPVYYLGGPMGKETQTGYAAAVSLGVTEKYVESLNKLIFDDNKIPQNHGELMQVFDIIGIPAHQAEAQFKSFPIANMVNQYDQHTKDSKISGVPSVVINNKYLIVAKEVKGEAQYFALVNYLLGLDNDYYKPQK